MPTKHIRDLVYFDFDKAMSIWSQFQGGKLEHFLTRSEDSAGMDAGARAGIPSLLQVNMGAQTSGSEMCEELKVVHHDLLSKVESRLDEVNLLSDLTQYSPDESSSVHDIRSYIGTSSYIKAAGNSVIEDYQHILAISKKFNAISEFINHSSENTIKESAPYLEVKASIDQAASEIKSLKDRNEKTRRKLAIKTLENQLEELIKPDLNGVEDWILDGMQTWIKTFMPTRINFRIYPYPQFPSFQVLCNLKRECFIDDDLRHLLYGYGQRPNVPLTVTGLITSLPSEEGHEFDPMAEFEDIEVQDYEGKSEADKRRSFECAFRGIFGGMEGLEDFIRYSRYPNITVHPIAVYRDLRYESESES